MFTAQPLQFGSFSRTYINGKAAPHADHKTFSADSNVHFGLRKSPEFTDVDFLSADANDSVAESTDGTTYHQLSVVGAAKLALAQAAQALSPDNVSAYERQYWQTRPKNWLA